MEYTIRMIKLLRSRQGKTVTVPVGDQLAIMNAAYRDISSHFNSYLETLRSRSEQRGRMIRSLGWKEASKDSSWKEEDYIDWEHQLMMCPAGRHGPSFRAHMIG